MTFGTTPHPCQYKYVLYLPIFVSRSEFTKKKKKFLFCFFVQQKEKMRPTRREFISGSSYWYIFFFFNPIPGWIDEEAREGHVGRGKPILRVPDLLQRQTEAPLQTLQNQPLALHLNNFLPFFL